MDRACASEAQGREFEPPRAHHPSRDRRHQFSAPGRTLVRQMRNPAFMPYLNMLIRAAKPEDAMGVACVHVRSWQAAYRTLLPDAYLDQLRPEDRAKRYEFDSADPRKPHTIVAAEGETICAFATTAPSHDSDLPNHGELCALHVDPGWWGKGIGVALVSAARARLLELGFRSALLWVLAGNFRAERFYRNDGWSPDGVQRTDSVWGVTVNELRYRREL
jgi:GNAT superfamily N-acetyltransferase